MKSLPAWFYSTEQKALLNKNTLLNLALTYQGDIYQRLGETKKTITYLEAARDTTPHADAAAQGNGIQLLGRSYLRVNNVDGFERTMAQSEDLTHAFDPKVSSTHGHYSLGTVYEEYGRSYANLGLMQKALDYLDLTKPELPQTKFWELLLTTARAIALVKGKELRAGLDLAAQAANECIETGNIRFLDRIYIIDHYVEEMSRDIMQLRKPVREALHRGQVTEI
jgi:tetratricopeptide (TPR) repeat protein